MTCRVWIINPLTIKMTKSAEKPRVDKSVLDEIYTRIWRVLTTKRRTRPSLPDIPYSRKSASHYPRAWCDQRYLMIINDFSSKTNMCHTHTQLSKDQHFKRQASELVLTRILTSTLVSKTRTRCRVGKVWKRKREIPKSKSFFTKWPI